MTGLPQETLLRHLDLDIYDFSDDRHSFFFFYLGSFDLIAVFLLSFLMLDFTATSVSSCHFCYQGINNYIKK